MGAEMEKLPLTLRYDCPDCLTWWETYYDTERDDDCPECGSLCAPTRAMIGIGAEVSNQGVVATYTAMLTAGEVKP